MAKSHEKIKTIATHYLPAMFVIWVFALYLGMPDRSWMQITTGISFMYFWIYFIHRGLHYLPKDGWIGWFNTHWRFHHQQEKLLHRSLELVFEFFTDISMNLLIIPIQWLLGVWFVPLSAVLLHTIVYTSAHIVNYSMIGSQIHRNHHKNLDTNFGPDVLDHLYGTNHDDTMEDMSPFIINAIIAFGIVLWLKKRYCWED